MKRKPKTVWPIDPRTTTPLYLAWHAALDEFYAHGFDQSRYEAVRAARLAYLASVAQ